ncbi:ribosomal RNA large subunit methyltransferase J [Phlyctochytrium arcticum]|nr:ribosomal RNA large subunit methyltransferase J [Phlyctochytrium arcticum]KAI9098840.1 ribosomal RNA large subunit methyltransferase J [Phlyctochytrium arcticum]
MNSKNQNNSLKYSNKTQWLTRQKSDPYVRSRPQDNYRSRAAYKLVQMSDKHRLFRAGMRVLDLGGCPGGWAQVAAAKVGGRGRVVSVDLLEMDTIAGVEVVEGDMTDPGVLEEVQRLFMGDDSSLQESSTRRVVDIVMSDMAHPFTGSRTADVARVLNLCRLAFSVAAHPSMLKLGGTFVCKFFQGSGDADLKRDLGGLFDRVLYEKPDASRKGSAEGYIVCLGYKGGILPPE